MPSDNARAQLDFLLTRDRTKLGESTRLGCRCTERKADVGKIDVSNIFLAGEAAKLEDEKFPSELQHRT